MLSTEDSARILREYDDQKPRLELLASKSKTLLDSLLHGEGIMIHSITERCKSKESLQGKLGRLAKNEKTYKSLSDVTDIAAVRIISYFEKDIDQIASVVKKNFSVDPENSEDKRKKDDPDRFGYQSLHYVLSFSSERLALGEYASFEGLKFELQIRSILQHAWAEIEHDLGYKSSTSIPVEVRRRFSRAAGLLEIVDSEFSGIREDLASYQRKLPKEIMSEPGRVGIDKDSLEAVINSETSSIRKLSEIVAEIAKANLVPWNPWYESGFFVEDLRDLNIKTIAELDNVASDPKVRKDLAKFTRAWMNGETYGVLDQAIGLFYMIYMLIGRSKNDTIANAFVNRWPFAEPDALVKRIFKTYDDALTTQVSND